MSPITFNQQFFFQVHKPINRFFKAVQQSFAPVSKMKFRIVNLDVTFSFSRNCLTTVKGKTACFEASPKLRSCGKKEQRI
jgi:hypothetical protein